MIPIVFALAPQPVQPVVIEQPQQAVVIYQAAPRPFAGFFQPRPQVFVIQGQCVGGQCPK